MKNTVKHTILVLAVVLACSLTACLNHYKDSSSEEADISIIVPEISTEILPVSEAETTIEASSEQESCVVESGASSEEVTETEETTAEAPSEIVTASEENSSAAEPGTEIPSTPEETDTEAEDSDMEIEDDYTIDVTGGEGGEAV